MARVPGFWVPACAGMTWACAGTTGEGLNRGLRGFSQVAYDAPRPFVPGFWVPACAGKTGGWRGNDGLFTLTPGFKPGQALSPLP